MRALALACFAALTSVAVTSRADEPPRFGLSTSLLAGWGSQMDALGSTKGVDAYRFGLGARAGTTLPMRLYVGGTFVGHVGTDQSAQGGNGAVYAAQYHDFYAGPEVGYDVDLGHWLLRPYLGFGLLFARGSTRVTGGAIADDHTYFHLAPGALFAYRIDRVFVGVDARMTIVPAQLSDRWAPAAFVALGAQLGAR